ncbi:anthocyanidin 3-O-galactosyltransferase 3GT6 [Rhododendron vialii]|uniref:anthocyanidin 3-O-galactosyltransferase 3GT6 n=1 Tax=Rhododendron vialii TaxID=182163 RepID=UPI00265D7249|nr:anthocyanidin 3-O-galactosyltransferase 3GT6 [Rhododendron vialii]
MTNSSKDRHVAVLPFPFSTHAAPILSIIRRLASAAPNVTFSFFSTPQSIQTLFPSENRENNIRPHATSDGVPEGFVFSGKHHEDINLFLAAGKESFEAGMKAAEEETGRRIDCVVSDAFMWFSCELAEEMGVPWVALWTSGACSLAAHCYTDLIRETVGMHDTAGREDEIVKFVPGFSEVRLGDLPSGVVYGNLESPFSMMLYKMGQVLHKATAVAINSFDELEPEPMKVLASKFQKLLTCGPFNSISPLPSSNLDEYGCIPWLDRRKAASVAYIGFGSVATPPPVELAALAEALEARSTPFLWSLRDNFKQHLPEGFLKRTSELGKIVPWAPQVQVLEHRSVGVFLTHCGWNSVMESVEAGVPIIGRPFFGDQQVDAWMVENVWKIGVRVEGGVFTEGSTMSALELVLSHEKGKELREQVGKYKEFALKAFGPKGRSTQNLNTLMDIVAGYDL